MYSVSKYHLAVVLLLTYLFLLFKEFDTQSYLSSQVDLFVSLNLALSALPGEFWSSVTKLGEVGVLLPIVAIFLYKSCRLWMSLLFAAICSGILTTLGKKIFAIPRPAAVLDPEAFNIIGRTLSGHNSFPSGHTTTAFTVFFILVFAQSEHIKQATRTWLVPLSIVAPIMVGLSRVAMGAHWAGDVMVGSLIGLFSAYWGCQWANSLSFARLALISNKFKVGGVGLLMLVWSQVLFQEAFAYQAGYEITFISAAAATALAFVFMQPRKTKFAHNNNQDIRR